MDNTPYADDLALSAKNNEAISEVLTLREEDGTPVDLTGRQFRAQARKGKLPTADLICDIEVTVEGDPTEGKLRLTVATAVITTLAPVKGHYDVLTRVGANGPVDNLYMAPFVIEGGVTAWN